MLLGGGWAKNVRCLNKHLMYFFKMEDLIENTENKGPVNDIFTNHPPPALHHDSITCSSQREGKEGKPEAL